MGLIVGSGDQFVVDFFVGFLERVVDGRIGAEKEIGKQRGKEEDEFDLIDFIDGMISTGDV